MEAVSGMQLFRMLDAPQQSSPCGTTFNTDFTSTSINPAIFQAEDFCEQNGIQVDTNTQGTTTTTYAGWLDSGDWIGYDVYIPYDAWFQPSYRVASMSGEGSFQVEWFGSTDVTQGRLALQNALPNTGGWYNWETLPGDETIFLTKGTHSLAIKVLSGGFNLDWWQLEPTKLTSCVKSSAIAIPHQFGTQDSCDSRGLLLEDTDGTGGGGQNFAFMDAGDWVAIHIAVDQADTYEISFRVSSPTGQGSLKIDLFPHDRTKGKTIGQVSSFPATGSWQGWETVSQKVSLPAGTHTVMVQVTEPGWNLHWVGIAPPGETYPTASPVSPWAQCFNGTPIVLEGTTRVEAEDFCNMEGFATENTADVDGDLDLGWTDTGDWAAYTVKVEESTDYNLAFRISSTTDQGGFRIHMYADSSSSTGDVVALVNNLPNTGGWQNWETVTAKANLKAGNYVLVFEALSPGFNINWFSLTSSLQQPTAAPSAPNKVSTVPTNIITPAPVAPNPVPQPVPAPSPPVSTSVPPLPAPAPTLPPTKKTFSGSSTTTFVSSGFVHAQGTSIVDGNGKNLILRGMGFGGWMLQEPYMMLVTDSAPDGQFQIFQNIIDLIGQDKFNTYHEAWLDNWCTQEDIAELKQAGFNSLRVALHYNLFTLPIQQEPVANKNTWLQSGFDRLDALVKWCKEEQVYLILDLHAAPGGQGHNAAISDYDSSKPSLFESTANQDKMVALWVQFAERYKNETVIAGYDILNEPNWNFVAGGHPNGCSETANAPLKALYDRTIDAIRKVDTNHLIIIEGNCWANNHAGLWPFSDDNVALSFHRYWIDNSQSSIQQFLDWRDEYSVPLWMGESGENNNFWYSEAVQLLESNNIGWSWWTWKKLQSDTGPFTINTPSGYQQLVDYWAWGGNKPSVDTAYSVMMELADNALLANCVRNDATITALTNPVRSCDETSAVTISSSSSTATRLEAENYCSMLGFQTEDCHDTGGGYDMGWTDAGDYLAFRVNVPTSGSYTVKYRISSQLGDGSFELTNHKTGAVLGKIESVPTTGDWQNWQTVSNVVKLSAGDQVLAVVALAPGWNLNWLEISPSS